MSIQSHPVSPLIGERRPSPRQTLCKWFDTADDAAPLDPAGANQIAWLRAEPAAMFVFRRFLSGVPWTERQALRSRGEDYRGHQRHTAIFFPWFPRGSAPGVAR